jgi:hypothetical protein
MRGEVALTVLDGEKGEVGVVDCHKASGPLPAGSADHPGPPGLLHRVTHPTSPLLIACTHRTGNTSIVSAGLREVH